LTGLERVRSLLDQRRPDCTPVIPFIGSHSVRFVDRPLPDAFADGALQARAQIAAVAAYAPDGIFPFMDLTVEPEALGARVEPVGALGIPAQLSAPCRTPQACIDACLAHLSASRLDAFVEAVRLMRESLRESVLVGAYVTGPFTLASELLGLARLARMLRRDPTAVSQVVAACAQFGRTLVARYERAHCVVVLEPCASASIASPADVADCIVPHIEGLLQTIRACSQWSVLHVCGNATPVIEALGALNADVLSVDWQVDLSVAADVLGPGRCLMGNVDTVDVLRSSGPAQVRQVAAQCIRSVPVCNPFILSTGCEVPLDTPPDNIHALIQAGDLP